MRKYFIFAAAVFLSASVSHGGLLDSHCSYDAISGNEMNRGIAITCPSEKEAYGRIECGANPGDNCVEAYGKIKCGSNCRESFGRIQCD